MSRLAWTAIAALLAGCSVDAFCLDCREDDAAIDGGGDSGWALRGDGAPTHPGDASSARDGCTPGAVELCNDADDDCDGLVDEAIDRMSDEDNCGECGLRCAPPHAFGACEGGACALTSCDVGFLDLDEDPSNGCEYRCLQIAGDDVICDLADDDCDGAVDEDVDLAGDPSNCGSCGRVCAVPHGIGGCTSGACVLAACDEGHHDLDGSSGNGCEYACALADPPIERCNLSDDDCDGSVDEGEPDAGGACGSDTGACMRGVEVCAGGALVCTGAMEPVTETCDGVDEDCDGAVDEGDPDGGRVCGVATGACEQGRETCVGGALVCVGSTGGGPESCNGLDDDCDGVIDEGNPGGGATCGSSVGACRTGVEMCRGGVLVCEGAVGPATEACNGIDDDCDGTADDGDPGGGGSCGTDAGECTVGVRRCMGGALSCVGALGPNAESCNGLDDDCDGSVDEGDPGGGASCGSDVGACSAGTMRCSGGALSCQGAVIGTLETCNGVDDDCDASTDEGYSLLTDTRNCGACGNRCAFANAIPACVGGACRIGGCITGFHDLDGIATNGCEYVCDVAGAEVCNGRDDDCDGSIDEALTPPSRFCNPNGVCAGTSATCAGAAGWRCSYPSSYQSDETECDSLDNDCDGRIDESHPLVGSACTNGELGECRRTGTYVCSGAGTGVTCTAAPSSGPRVEACNGLDDDCDGALDESAPAAWVQVSGSFGTRWMMAYEASRPDAWATSEGSMAHRVCSEAGRLPWTNVTYAEAQAACATVGARLCTEAEWQRACEASSGGCDWSFASSCTSYPPNSATCNGNDYDSSAAPGDQDALLRTGALSTCYADWGGAGRIFDLSGNAEEWTQRRSSGVNPLRGGSYNDTSGGMRCDFDFVVANDTFRVPNVGFRCCRSTAP